MTTTVIPGQADDFAVMAGQLLAIAADLGYEPRVVSITHDPGQVFVVPDDVAEKFNEGKAAQAAETPKRRRRAVDAEGADEK